LRKSNWCTNYGSTSKLSTHYYNKDGDEEAWRERVKEFLIALKPYCGDDDDEYDYEPYKYNLNWY